MYRSCKINFKDNEILAWTDGHTRYAIIKKGDSYVDQAGRLIDNKSSLKAAMEAAMR